MFLPFISLRFATRRVQASAAPDEGEADTGIAGSGFHDNASGTDGSIGLYRLDHGNRNPVVHTGQRIEKFELGENIRDTAVILGKSVDADERRVA